MKETAPGTFMLEAAERRIIKLNIHASDIKNTLPLGGQSLVGIKQFHFCT